MFKQRFANLLKMKSIVTLIFVVLTVLAVVKSFELPEWLVPIIAMCYKELFDKDKIKTSEEAKNE